MRTRVLLPPLLLFLGLALLLPGQAIACSCVGPQPGERDRFHREMFRAADGAIIGKLLRVRPGESEMTSKYVYRVSRAYKGKGLTDGRILRVRSASSGAACGIGHPIGTRRGLFLFRSDGRWHGSSCATVSARAMRKAARQVQGDGAVSGSAAGCSAATGN